MPRNLCHAAAPAAPTAPSRSTLKVIVAATVAAAGCGGSESPPATTAEARGQALYAGTGVNCVQCHTDAATLRRDAADAAVLADRIAAAVAANTGRMGDAQYGYANLTRAELLDLAAYLVSRAPVASTPPPPPPPSPPPPPPAPAPAAVQCTSTGSSSVRTEGFTSGLSSPWAMAFLPDNRVLVTQKGGTMVLVSANGATRTTMNWGLPAPEIRDGGQGGLLDVALDPDFATTPWVYFTYQEPGPNSTSGTAVGRARLQGSSLVDFQRLYQQTPKVGQDGVHFGSRLAFRSDKTLFVSLGDRGQDDPSAPTRNHAQNLAKTLGKVIRINRDGSIPSDNPFQGQSGALPEIWSLGHRNPQGLTYDATSGALWNTEHGPQGGDELNRVLPGANYAWPLRSYGCPYGATEGAGCRVGGGTHLPLNGTTFNEPVTFWAPTSTAPSNVIVYRGSGFPEWNGQLFIGALAGQRLWRVTLNGTAFASCEAMLSSLNQRIRDVRQGPDGWIWVLTDGGEIRRVLR
jgi:glucose/arabinose dehydrogenase